MKLLVFILFISLTFANLKDQTYQIECEVANDIQLVSCLLELNPNITSISISQENYSNPDISSLSTFLPQNPQLTSIRLSFFDVQETSSFYSCLTGLTNLTHLDLNFSRFYKFIIPNLEYMLQDQLNSLTHFSLNLASLVTDIQPIADVIRKTVNVETLYLNVLPETWNIKHPVIENLQSLKGGLFANYKNLQNLEFVFMNTDWSQEQQEGFSEVFKGANDLRNLIFNLNNCQIQDASFLQNVFTQIDNMLESLVFEFVQNPVKSFEPIKNAFDMQINIKNLIFQIGTSMSYTIGNEVPKTYFSTMNSLFTGLANLETLIFKVGDIDTEDFNFEQLDKIFSNPNLKVLEASFYFMNLTSLENFQNVTIGLNNLTTLSLDFNLNSLKGNQLSNFDEAFKNIPNLNSLRFSFYFNSLSEISDLPIALQSIPNVTYLNMDFSGQLDDIKSLDGLQTAFQNIPLLKTLIFNVSSNKIQNIDQLVAGLQDVQQIQDFSGNFNNNCLEKESLYYTQQIQNALPQASKILLSFADQGDFCQNIQIQTE